ncbi:MAG: glycosyltransferase family 4 protein [Hyphomicrobiales bacterium]|nr:glycosyltransferase family 4 protein [Hyphomicrobiales bacterium]
MRVLTFTTLFPNAVRPQHGIFVENRLRHLVADAGGGGGGGGGGGVEARVVAPVPWFPSRNPRFGAYADFARVPAAEQRHGLAVLHPRYPLIPKVGMTLAPWLLYRACLPVLRRVRDGGFPFDVIDAHYVYPDGVAAVMLARRLGVPVVVTARGTDINLLPDYAGPRRMIRWALARADGLVAVSAALARRMTDLGADPARLAVLRNGVDLDRFRPPAGDRAPDPAAPRILSAGNLVPLKGHDLVIGALAALPGARLRIAGDGPERGNLARQAADLGVADRVTFLGKVAHGDMPALYGDADVLVLASSREGMPNVVLEAMACGTPVVASRVGGIPEVVDAPAAGRLFDRRTAADIAAALAALFADPPARAATRRHAERFDWRATSDGQMRMFARILKP